ncbi:MAG: dihydrofolate reductase family protein [Candidatus Woesearchaeota archaeon]|nr:dihydrofolate reductase family protein [Candidatus Woesearchaeota archaeon]
MKSRTFNTLFMLSSVDGKISTGSIDQRDVDKDLPKIKGVVEGLKQYYDLEMRTDLHSFNTGRVMAKIGMNKKKKEIVKLPVSFIIVDNKPHLNNIGLDNLTKKCKVLYLVTTNKKHPAFKREKDNLKVIYYHKKIDFPGLFKKLRQEFDINRVTIQSGGTMNSLLIRAGLIDELSLVIAPVLIGGKNTATLVDGKSLISEKDLIHISALKLKKCVKLNNSYLNLVYEVLN